MAGEWRKTTLDQLGRIVTGKTPPSNRPDYFGGDIPFVTPTDFDGRRIIETTARYLTEAGADSVSARIPARAVMVSCIGSDMGKAAIAGRDCVTNQQINSVIVAGQDDPLFVYYNLSTRKAEIRGAAGGSAQPILNKSAFGRLEIQLPPPAEQRAIAHILGTLDDKIELNRRMSETLEQMARALFKAWFVDFEPVRAKMEGRWRRGESLPGLPAHLYDLFPDRLVDSELGEIPEGWEVTEVGRVVDIVKGVSYRSNDLAESPVALVTLKSFNRGGGYRPDGLKPYRGPYKPEQEILQGELIVAQTDVTQSAEVIGKPALVVPDPRFRTLVASLDVLIVRPKSPDLCQEFFYLLFLTPRFQEHIYGHTNGTTVLHLGKQGVTGFRFAKPPSNVMAVFSKLIKPLLAQKMAKSIESRTLAALRDALLPKLVSGELRVKDAERFLKERGL